MTKRVASGQLSEILGADFIKVDAFFKTLGFDEHADDAVKKFMSGDSLPYQKAAKAYLKGVNQFIVNGSTPVEFVMLGIDKRNLQLKTCIWLQNIWRLISQWLFEQILS